MRVQTGLGVFFLYSLLITACGGKTADAVESHALYAAEESEFEEEQPGVSDGGESEVAPPEDPGEIPPPPEDPGEIPPPPEDPGEIPPPPNNDSDEFTPVESATKNTNDMATDANAAEASAESAAESDAAADAAADAEAAAEAEAADMDAYVVRHRRCRFGQPDPDHDGLCTALELEFGTDPAKTDTDDDGLSDGMEIAGYRIRSTGELVTLPNASPLHKDVYVDISHVGSWRPTDAAIQWVVNLFANAPVPNKDGTTGITLHTFIDEKPIEGSDYVTFPERYRVLKGDYFQASHTPAYHWALFAGSYQIMGSSGSSYAPSTELIITLGGQGFLNNDIEQAGTFMHELGHNLGLPHGGLTPGSNNKFVMDHTNYKPTYFSIMNYAYQTRGVPGADGSSFLDYSRATVGALDESKLNELRGFRVPGTDEAALALYGAPFICTQQLKSSGIEYCNPGSGAFLWGSPSDTLDFNFNQCIDSTIVTADLNGNGAADVFSTSVDDWTHLTYDGGNVIGNLRRVGARVAVVEGDPITCMTAEAIDDAVSRVVVDTPPPLCAAAPAQQ